MAAALVGRFARSNGKEASGAVFGLVITEQTVATNRADERRSKGDRPSVCASVRLCACAPVRSLASNARATLPKPKPKAQSPRLNLRTELVWTRKRRLCSL